MQTARIWFGFGVTYVALAAFAHAQTPTNAQRNAIRQACSADYRSACASVPTGGRPALQCLQQHASSLSSPCQAAVAALSSGGGPQPARLKPALMAQRLREACRADYLSFCQGVRPGGGRALMCLHDHRSELSPGCQASLASTRR